MILAMFSCFQMTIEWVWESWETNGEESLTLVLLKPLLTRSASIMLPLHPEAKCRYLKKTYLGSYIHRNGEATSPLLWLGQTVD